MKLIALSPKGYVKDNMNIFDGLIVVVSVVDYSVSQAINLKALRGFRVIRSLRVLRVSRLLRSLKYMTVIVRVIQECFVDFLDICKFLYFSITHGFIYFHFYTTWNLTFWR